MNEPEEILVTRDPLTIRAGYVSMPVEMAKAKLEKAGIRYTFKCVDDEDGADRAMIPWKRWEELNR